MFQYKWLYLQLYFITIMEENGPILDFETQQDNWNSQADAHIQLHCENMYWHLTWLFLSRNWNYNNGQWACMCQWLNWNQPCDTLSQEYLTQQLCANHASWDVIWSIWQWACSCPAWITDDGQCIRNNYGNLGIECSPDQMRNGTCSRNINKTLGIRSSETRSNPTLLVQDIVLTATSFIGTMMVIALLVMGFKYVMGGMDESSTGDLKWNIKKLLIWLGLVIGSYTIIRLIQYIARGY